MTEDLFPEQMKNAYNLIRWQPNKLWAHDLNRHFLKEDTRMADKHMKSCTMSLVIREMQIKTTMGYEYISIRIAKIKKTDTTKGWQKYGATK